MNSMPRFALNLIIFFIGAPAACARSLGIVFACVEGIVVFTGAGGSGAPLSRYGLNVGHPGLAAIAFAWSILGYLMEVLLAYIAAEDRQALPPRTVAILMGAEAAIQSLGVVTVCLLAAAGFRDGSNRYFGVAGTVAAVATGFLFIRFNRRILQWREAWQGPPASWPEDDSRA